MDDVQTLKLVTTQVLQKEYLTGVPLYTIRQWAREGTIPSCKPGKNRLYDPIKVLKELTKYE